MKQRLFLLLIPITGLLAACASSTASTASTATSAAVSQTRAGFTEAALSPLEDLNLRKDEIPPVLADIDNPYAVSQTLGCEDITSRLAELDAVLPPDWDAAHERQEDSSLSDKAADTASDGVLGVVASEARGLIPYRGWVRRLSGANSHDKKVKAALERGNAQRTYLKAIGRMKSCKGIPDIPKGQKRKNLVDYRGDAPSSAQKEDPPAGPVDLRGARTSEAQISSNSSAH
ncbi:hypothetical protein [Henriciella sp.]|jgi:hypothetical protein|uniref:hypothetical protein n=1 Tax=Henriciella sp. TaxID=1968823 RepID=UPI0025BFE70A|nr:hypothetical protein [Henriciella sp.]|tara:strand:- start:4413 stop:5105 length:693 start_codon:yes stop_codon:yes gene_type:complete